MVEDKKAEWTTPPNWLRDKLTEFIETAYRNRVISSAKLRVEFDRLIMIDGMFVNIFDKMINPKDQLAPLFLLRCHSAFRATVEHAAAGQLAEMFPQMRACLEYAAYAYHISKNPGLSDVWLSRHDDPSAKKAVRKEFSFGNVNATLKATGAKTSDVFETLYERAIDLGAHPNERAVTSSLQLETKDGVTHIKQTYIHNDPDLIAGAMKCAAQTGVCALDIFQMIFGALFEIIGVRYQLLELRKGDL